MENEIEELFCICCLQTDMPLLNVEKCLYTNYLKTVLINAQLVLPTFLVCHPCHGFLKKIELFRKQVIDNFNILYDYVIKKENNSKTCFRTLQLERSKTVTDSFPIPTHKSDFEESKELEVDSDLKNFNFESVVTNVKAEYFDESDIDLDIPLSEIKNENFFIKEPVENRKRIKNKRKEKVDPNITKKGKVRLRKNIWLDPKKIKMLVMSKEELLQDREKESQSAAYLKFSYKCEKCVIGFDYEQTLQDHEERRHDMKIGEYICEVCSSVFKSQASYSTHCRRHLLRFECVACGKRTMDKDAMLKHYGSAHEQITTAYTCDECGLVSLSYRAHRYHREKHREKPQCADCGKTFINKNSLRLHILNIHQCERTFPCAICGKVYKGKSGLSQHMWAHESSLSAGAYCAPCGVQFKTSYNYRHHLKTHSRHLADHDLRYTCSECGAVFASARRRRAHHEREHSAHHACSLCDKTFKGRVGLERHKRFVHEKRRPPRNKMCHHCGRGFTTAAILRAHIRTHTGERPLRCSTCSATFAHSAALYTHNKLLHGRKPDAEET